MAKSIVLLSPEQARSATLRSLGFTSDPGETGEWYEILRSVVWAISSQDRPIHVVRILNLAATIAFGLESARPDDRQLRSNLRERLDELSAAGDLIEGGRGYWLPAPTRVVRFNENDVRLLVGGLPSRMIAANGSGQIEHHGPFRHLQRLDSSSLALPVEDAQSWARLPKDLLTDWAALIIGSVELTPYAAKDDGRFEFYLAGHSPQHVPQFKRWSSSTVGLHGTYLARRTRVFGLREYRLMKVEQGIIKRSGEIPTSVVRRLMYAIDSRENNPVMARWNENSYCLQVATRSELPREEQRFFAAFGTVEVPPDRPYERIWSFRSHHGLVRERLRSLHIQIVESQKVIA